MDASPVRNSNPLQQFYGSRKSFRWVIFLVVAALAIIYMTGQSVSPASAVSRVTSVTSGHKSKTKAKSLSPATLMERPISKDLQTIPKLIHQSWSSHELPTKFEKWSDTCRRQHSDWEWVLWTDKDNEELVKTHFPWLLKTYRDLPGVIFRADMARNLYMYMFGGYEHMNAVMVV